MDLLVIEKMNDFAEIPRKAHPGDLGYDLFTDHQFVIQPGATELVTTGIRMKFPEGWGGKIFDRSGIAVKRGLLVMAGVIDNGYRGEVKIVMHNTTSKLAHIARGEAIAQLVPIPTVDWHVVTGLVELHDTARGEGGFGSTNA